MQDSTCGSCHQPAYEQTLESVHFAGRQLRPLDDDQPARVALRHEGFAKDDAAVLRQQAHAADVFDGRVVHAAAREHAGCDQDEEHRSRRRPDGAAGSG